MEEAFTLGKYLGDMVFQVIVRTRNGTDSSRE
jgi:hypothetical protein